MAQGPHRRAEALFELLGAPAGISATLRMLLTRRRAAWRRLDADLGELDRLLVGHARSDVRCRRLMTIPGLGPITATALVAAVNDGQACARARDRAAWPTDAHTTVAAVVGFVRSPQLSSPEQWR